MLSTSTWFVELAPLQPGAAFAGVREEEEEEGMADCGHDDAQLHTPRHRVKFLSQETRV